MNHLYYKNRPIGSIDTLARILCVTPKILLQVMSRADCYYKPHNEPKKGGGFREVVSVAAPLKDIQRRIKSRILECVHYPDYLQGGIKDRNSPRDYVANARFHVGAKLVINEDIAQFFPSVSAEQVYAIWKNLFQFPPEVARCLTALTTWRGELPQGAATSTYLSNLMLWREEPGVVESVQQHGFKYSRLVDDMTVSSRDKINSSGKTFVVVTLRKMCNRQGFTLKRNKHRIYSSGQPMLVNNLAVNTKVSLATRARSKIRAAVFECENTFKKQHDIKKYRQLYDRTLGRVRMMHRMHRKDASALLERLVRCKPISNL